MDLWHSISSYILSFIFFSCTCTVQARTSCCIFMQLNLAMKLQFSIPSTRLPTWEACRCFIVVTINYNYVMSFSLSVSQYKFTQLKHAVHVWVLKNLYKGDGAQQFWGFFVTVELSMQTFSCYGNLQLMKLSSKPYFATTLYNSLL